MLNDKKIPILLVDDRPENLLALEALLNDMKLNLELTMASSGNEALRQSLKQDFALILLDVQMPVMGGIETATLLRVNPKTCHIPIIFITAGMTDKENLFVGYESGAVDYLVKPIEAVILRSKVRIFCELYLQRIEIEYSKANLETLVAQRTEELSSLAKNLTLEINTRKITEVALTESELRLRRLIDSANEAFIGMDNNGAVFDWNPYAEVMFGWTKEEALHRSVAELIIPPRYRAAHTLGLQHYSISGESPVINRRIEISAQDKSGCEFPVELNIWLIPNAATRIFGAFIHDISERKRNEEKMRVMNAGLEVRVEERTKELRLAMDQIVESEKLASLGGIVAGVAHELNTPIGNIVMMASTLGDRISGLSKAVKDGHLTKTLLGDTVLECQEASNLIVRSAHRASELIESFKKVAVDQTSQRRRVFDLRETVSDILNTLGTTMRHAKASSELHIPAGIELDSFPGDLEQIFNNLIMNSIKHGFEAKAGHIKIEACRHENMVEIIYQDDGIGIETELHHKVFEPFYTTKLGQGGSGLGMFIVHNLVCGSLKGEIKLQSEPGKGVRFSITIPLITP
ncbi:MAG: ATP-binding protein [Pseudomonadota bacterium]